MLTVEHGFSFLGQLFFILCNEKHFVTMPVINHRSVIFLLLLQAADQKPKGQCHYQVNSTLPSSSFSFSLIPTYDTQISSDYHTVTQKGINSDYPCILHTQCLAFLYTDGHTHIKHMHAQLCHLTLFFSDTHTYTQKCKYSGV